MERMKSRNILQKNINRATIFTEWKQNIMRKLNKKEKKKDNEAEELKKGLFERVWKALPPFTTSGITYVKYNEGQLKLQGKENLNYVWKLNAEPRLKLSEYKFLY